MEKRVFVIILFNIPSRQQLNFHLSIIGDYSRLSNKETTTKLTDLVTHSPNFPLSNDIELPSKRAELRPEFQIHQPVISYYERTTALN